MLRDRTPRTRAIISVVALVVAATLALPFLLTLMSAVSPRTSAPLSAYRPPAGSTTTLVVIASLDSGDTQVRGDVTETSTEVRVSVSRQPADQASDEQGVPVEVGVELSRPLGDRVVIDAATGQQLEAINY